MGKRERRKGTLNENENIVLVEKLFLLSKSPIYTQDNFNLKSHQHILVPPSID